MSSTWTDDRVDLLIRLWRDGASTRQIAAALGGVTRNAVIGKAHRLGLGGRARPARPGSRRPRPPRFGPRLPRPRYAASAPPRRILESAPLSGLASIATIGPRACRWPIGDPKDPGFALCGRPACRGAYCAAHGAIAYRPSAPDHLLKLAGLA